MCSKADQPKRKRLRLECYDYAENGYYFVTICTKNRQNYFARPVGNGFIRSAAGILAEEHLLKIPEHHPGITVDQYVVMPNHIHAIFIIEGAHSGRMNPAPTLSSVIGQYKAGVSRQLGFPIWQKSFYDHVIRNETDYQMIWQYIENNPLKWELDRFYADDT